MHPIANDMIVALPEVFVAVLAMALLMVGVFRGDKSARAVAWMSVGVLVFAMVLVLAGPIGRNVVFNDLFVSDDFADYTKVLLLAGSALAIVMAIPFNAREGIARFEFPILMLFAALGMMMMVSANNLMSLYIGVELQALAAYVIAAFRRDTLRSSEAGLKYFVLGALSSGMMLYGMSMVYGFAGTTSFDALATVFAAEGEAAIGLVIGVVFIICGLAFKISAVPFHMWTPDVYEGAPTPVTAFFAVAPKIAGLGLFVRVMMGPFGELADVWQQVIVVIAIASMLLGALAAINQRNIKRLMAYSSIGHMGYALVGLAAANEAGVQGVLLYVTIYLFMNVGTFACILSMRRQGEMVEGIDDLKGLSKTNPLMALALTIFMFSLAGIPPLAGFFGKLYVFLAAVEAGLYTLAVLGLLTSVIAAFYYLRIVKLMYFDDPVEAFDRPVGRAMTTILAATSLVTLLFLVFLSPVLESAGAAARALFLA